MSIIELFKEKFGDNFIIEDRSSYKDIVMSYCSSIHCAILRTEDLEKAKGKMNWKPFSLITTNFKHDYLQTDDTYGFSTVYIKKAIEVISPYEYAIYEDYNKESGRKNKILALRNQDYTIIIAPRTHNKEFDGDFEFAKMKDYLKEVPKDVFVL